MIFYTYSERYTTLPYYIIRSSACLKISSVLCCAIELDVVKLLGAEIIEHEWHVKHYCWFLQWHDLRVCVTLALFVIVCVFFQILQISPKSDSHPVAMSTSSLRRQVKNIVHNYSEAEIKVRA